jgi:hypothetical protein
MSGSSTTFAAELTVCIFVTWRTSLKQNLLFWIPANTESSEPIDIVSTAKVAVMLDSSRQFRPHPKRRTSTQGVYIIDSRRPSVS